jgi:hypothetical protein
VEIEESSDEEEEAQEEPPAVKATSSTAPSRSLRDLKKKEFKELIKKLQKSEAERVIF